MDASSNVKSSDFVPTRTDQATVASTNSAALAPVLNSRQAGAANGQRVVGSRTDTPSNDEERPVQASTPLLQTARSDAAPGTPAGLPATESALSEAIRSTILEKDPAFIKDKNTLFDFDDGQQLTLLHSAAMVGRSDKVIELIEMGASTDFPNKDGTTALMLACRHGHLETARLLLAHGASIEQTDNDGETPLLLAVRAQKEELIECLIKNGANVKHANAAGNTAMMLAVSANDCAAATLLLTRGADAEHLNKRGDNALLHAACHGFKGIVTLLLDHGVKIETLNAANLEHIDKFGYTPLTAAIYYNDFTTVMTLIMVGADIETPTPNGTPLTLAAELGARECVSLLVERGGARINRRNNDGMTPLMAACEKGRRELAQQLLDYGASLEKSDMNQETALFYAVAGKNESLITDLIQRGASLEHANSLGNTVLLHAIASNRPGTVALLLKAGADPTHINNEGHEALLQATSYEANDVVPVLLDYGVSLETVGPSGWTALGNAARLNHREIVALLISHGANLGHIGPNGITPVQIAFSCLNLSIGIMLIKAGASIDAPVHDFTFLMRATMVGDAKCAMFLIEKGADINEATDYGDTALMIASKLGRTNVVALLLQQGKADTIASLIWSAGGQRVSIDAQSDDGWSALAFAAYHGHVEIISLLLEANALVDLPDKSADTPLHHAIRKEQVGAVKMLLQHGANIAHKNKDGMVAIDIGFNALDPNSSVIDLLLERAFSVAVTKGKASGVINMEQLLDHICALLIQVATKTQDEAAAAWTSHTRALCTAFNLRHAVAAALVEAVQNMPGIWLGCGSQQSSPTPAQIRYFVIHTITTVQSFHELQLETTLEHYQSYDSTEVTPKSLKRLVHFAAGQAGFLLACGEIELHKWKHKLGKFLVSLTPETKVGELTAFLNSELGMHPLLSSHLVDIWGGLDGDRSMAKLTKAMQERLAAPAFITELETIGPDMLHSMLLEQMKIFF